MKAEIERLEAALGGLTIKASKGKKEKDPNAPKREANDYIKFTVRVGELFKTTIAAAKAAGDDERIKQLICPATINKQFCSFLKDQRSMEVEKDGKKVTVPNYAAWEDTEIIEAFESWTPPLQSKMELAKKAKDASADVSEASVAESDSAPSGEPKKERKKREPMSDEAKATMAAKRAATVAAKKVAEPAPVPVPVPAPALAPTPVPVPVPAVAKKSPAKKITKTYTIEELKKFSSLSIEGEDYGVNTRGDVMDNNCDFVGVYNVFTKKINRDAPKPENWDEISADDE